MNKKRLIISSVIAALLVGGGVAAYVAVDQQNKAEEEKMAMEKKAEDDAMMKEDETMAKDDAIKDDKMSDDSMKSDDVMMSKEGAYVTLATYNANKARYADSTKVYFFHAPWCPVCKAVNEEISADTSKIPDGVTLIKTDYDSNTALRQKYGVTYQYTFVQVDGSGNEVKQWSATNYDEVVDSMKV